MDAQLKAQLQNTILVANTTAVNDYGEKQYSTASSHLGRQIGRQTWIKDQSGQELRSDNQVIFTSTVTVSYDSRIWLQGESTSTYTGWYPMSIAHRYDENGNVDHIKVFLGAVGAA